MNINDFLDYLNSGKEVEGGSDIHKYMTFLSQEALKITSVINGQYNEPEEICKLISRLIGKPVGEGFGLFPPFHTDCGKNTHIGKNVFINSGCHFQDQGGIFIGDNVLIGHNVAMCTLNHNQKPSKRSNMIPKPIKIGNNVWIGSKATILQGVTIGENAIISAGAVVTKDVRANTVVVGVPAREIKEI